MSKILIVTGSARKGRVADSIVPLVADELASREDVTVSVANLKELDLPFFDDENTPATPGYKATDERVEAWTKLVDEADGIVILMPEYNHTLSAIQKNALDWVYAEWDNKPVSVVGYGWGGASLALVTLKEVLGHLKANLLPTATHLYFMKSINPDGSVVDESDVSEQIKATVDELLGEASAEPARELAAETAN
jgi:NAD(P)H-dependent FMN reductase